MKLPWKKDPDDRSVDALLAQANIAAPTGSFRMTVEDVFHIKGRGTVVTGRVETGSISVDQQVRVSRGGAVVGTTKVTGVEMFRKIVTTANAGDNVGLLVKDQVDGGFVAGDVLDG